MQPKLISIRDAATYLGLKPSTLYQRRLILGIRNLRIGRKILFDIDDLNAYIESQKNKTNTENY